MRLRLYSVHDRLSGIYLAPFPARTDVEACRYIKASLERSDMAGSAMVLAPSDHDLVYVATLDDETGQVYPEVAGSSQAVPRIISTIRGILTPVPAPPATEELDLRDSLYRGAL